MYVLSVKAYLFIECWKALELYNVSFNNPQVNPSTKAPSQPLVSFNKFIELLRTKAKTAQFKQKLDRSKEKINRRYKSAAQYLDSIFKNVTSRLLVIRLDLSYDNEFAHEVTVESAKCDIDHLLNNRRSNDLFHGWVGYIRKLEWAPQKRFHFHLIIIFDGNIRFQDNHIAKEIGEYWKNEITKGNGNYWNCNDSKKNSYKRLGIGMVEHDDIAKRKILLDDVIGYLTKTEQYLRATILNSDVIKLFVRGEMPSKRTTQAGRPRRKPWPLEGVI